jgi:ribosome-associated heat shock protein Hsp15
VTRETIRLDKWLWHARFFKTRSLAVKFVTAGGVRLNGAKIAKPAIAVGAGDGLAFEVGDRDRVVKITAIGTRRGPAPEAQTLYEDHSPPPRERDLSRPIAVHGGRPDKRARRSFAKPNTDALE